MAKALTEKAVEAMKPDGDKRREIPDGHRPGLYLIVQPSGRKGWAVRYRFGGKPRKLVLGSYPAVTLKDARRKATAAFGKVHDGIDPAAERKADKLAAADTSDLFDVVLEDFIRRYCRPKNRSWEETDRILRREALPVWKGRKVGEIAKRDVLRLIDGIVDRGAATMANRTFAAVRKLFAWCLERDLIAESPCAGLRQPAPNVVRERVLSDDELVACWHACDSLGQPFGPLVRLLILTGQRREEVTRARWSEIDLAAREWIIPGDRAKNGQPHVVPLSDAAVALIEGLPRIADPDTGRVEYLFTTTGKTPVSGWSKAKTRLDKGMVRHLTGDDDDSDETDDAVALEPWRIHDLRRTAASGMAGLGIGVEVVEKALNHLSGTFAGIVKVYQRHDFAAEKCAALDAWAVHVLRLVEGVEADNVVALRG